MSASIVVLIGGVATLGIFSFLIRENRFYRFFEHLFIGIATGLGVVLTIKNFLWPSILQPLLGLSIVTYPDGTSSGVYHLPLLLYLVPMVIGLFYYTIYSARFSWLAKIAIGISLGASGGVAFKGFANEMLPQILGSFKPLIVFHDGAIDFGQSFDHIVFVGTLLAVMVYFFFSFGQDQASVRRISVFGRWLMMGCFGAFFGSTVMARMALLVERIQFLLIDWWQAVMGLV